MSDSIEQWVDRTTCKRFLTECVLLLTLNLPEADAERYADRWRGEGEPNRMPNGIYWIPAAVASRAAKIESLDDEILNVPGRKKAFRDYWKQRAALEDLP
jgi:hypothetical protein